MNSLFAAVIASFFSEITFATLALAPLSAVIAASKSAMIAASCATVFSFVYIFFKYFVAERKNKVDLYLNISNIKKSAKEIFKEILVISIPLSVASFIMILGSNVDSITILKLLKSKLGEDLAREKYGILSSKVELLTRISNVYKWGNCGKFNT